MSILLLISSFVIALILSISITPLVLKFANTYHLLDQPDFHLVDSKSRRVHLRPIPRLGGIAIVLAFFMAYIVTQRNSEISSMLLLSLVIFAVGAIDDLKPISASYRFLMQVFVCCMTVYIGDLALERVYLTSERYVSLYPWFGFVLSVFIIVGAINALNMIDGLDGLAGGISIISLAVLSLLCYLSSEQNPSAVYLTIPVIGSILGFLRYNTHPASIFMGDNGSNWLGFIIGIHILLVLEPPTQESIVSSVQHVPILSVLLCFAVPVFDTAFVILRRVVAGRHPMSADKRHFHHKLLMLGLTQSQSVTFIYFISLAVSILGILPIAYPKYEFDSVPYIGLVLILSILFASVKVNWQSKYRNPIRSWLSRHYHYFSKRHDYLDRTIRIWEKVNKYCIFLILIVTPAFAGPIPRSVGLAAIPLCVLSFMLIFTRNAKNDFIESLILTISCMLLLIANNHNQIQIELLGSKHSIQYLYNALFIFLFFSSVIFLGMTMKKNYFVLTPSDFLLLTLPIILILFPENLKSEFRLDIISIRSFIIFLGYRILEKRRIRARRQLKLATFMALLYVIFVSILEMRLVY